MCDLISCGAKADKPLPHVTPQDRRAFLKGACALPLASVLAWPDLAKAAAGRTAPVSIPTEFGGNALGVIAMPAKTPAPAVLLIHEWWGLNDQIKAMAVELADQGYIALAADLYGGKVAKTAEDARTYMGATDAEVATEQLTALVNHLRTMKEATGKVGTIGWCFGGGWSLNCSLATPVDATVIYYGHVGKSAAQLAKLNSPLLGHFAVRDKWINKEMVTNFETAMSKAGKTALDVHWYDADHAFANPTSARYDEGDAATSWQRTLAFYKKHLR